MWEGKICSIEFWVDDMVIEVNVVCFCIVLIYGGGGCGLLIVWGVFMLYIIVIVDGEGVKIMREVLSIV